MRKTIKIGAGLALLGLLTLGAGCAKKATTNTTNTANSTNTTDSNGTTGTFTTNSSTTGTATSVSISGRAFSPASITVAKGTTVTWTNEDSLPHTVTGDNGGPASGQLSQGKTYPFTFTTAGTFTYHCTNHSDMTGQVIVTE